MARLVYGASATFTISLASLATSGTLVAGQQSTAIVNKTNLYADYLIGGRITAGTTPTAGLIQVYVYANVDDTPTYPDTITGTDGPVTMTSVDIRNASLKLLTSMVTDTTSNRVYWFGPLSLLSAYNTTGGGMLSVPKNFGLWVTQSTVVALNATPGNHVLSYTGVF